jgi:hypothetical protein
MFTVYEKVLLPIFQGALDKGLLNDIPKYDSVLETTHILPAKDSTPHKPIIAPFYSRNIQAMVFRLKKEYTPMKTITTTTSRKGDTTKKVFCYPPSGGPAPRRSSAIPRTRTSPRTPTTWCRPSRRTPGPVRFGPSTGTFVSDWMETQQSRRSPQCTTLWSPFLASRTFSK